MQAATYNGGSLIRWIAHYLKYFLERELKLTGMLPFQICVGTEQEFRRDSGELTRDDFLFLSENTILRFNKIGPNVLKRLVSVLEEHGYTLRTPYQSKYDYSSMILSVFLNHFNISTKTRHETIRLANRLGDGFWKMTVAYFLEKLRKNPTKVKPELMNELRPCFRLQR